MYTSYGNISNIKRVPVLHDVKLSYFISGGMNITYREVSYVCSQQYTKENHIHEIN